MNPDEPTKQMTFKQTQSSNPLFEYNLRTLAELKEGDQVILHNDDWTRPWRLTVYRIFGSGRVSFWEYNRGGNRRDGITIEKWTKAERNTRIERQERVRS